MCFPSTSPAPLPSPHVTPSPTPAPPAPRLLPHTALVFHLVAVPLPDLQHPPPARPLRATRDSPPLELAKAALKRLVSPEAHGGGTSVALDALGSEALWCAVAATTAARRKLQHDTGQDLGFFVELVRTERTSVEAGAVVAQDLDPNMADVDLDLDPEEDAMDLELGSNVGGEGLDLDPKAGGDRDAASEVRGVTQRKGRPAAAAMEAHVIPSSAPIFHHRLTLVHRVPEPAVLHVSDFTSGSTLPPRQAAQMLAALLAQLLGARPVVEVRVRWPDVAMAVEAMAAAEGHLRDGREKKGKEGGGEGGGRGGQPPVLNGHGGESKEGNQRRIKGGGEGGIVGFEGA